jgi:SAM-dependent methyltransferase
MATILKRLRNRVKQAMQGHVKHHSLYLPFVSGKAGLEIGGPSEVFRTGEPVDIYQYLASVDNCDFSSETAWANQQNDYRFAEGKPPGRNIYCDGSDLTSIADDSYDCVLSSHNLEHFANPVKALYEWKRVLRPNGTLILVLPYYKETFDHFRQPTSVDHMFEDFDNRIGEDDLTHLPEILEKHDLAKDPGAGSLENFRERSLANLSNRCLHHHVFDETNSRALLERAGFTVQCNDKAFPFHLCLLATLGNMPVVNVPG